MIDFVQILLEQSAGIPLLTAFLLGLLSAFNPCQLAINVSALTSLDRSEGVQKTQRLRRAWLYLAGRFATYVVLGWLCIGVLSAGWGNWLESQFSFPFHAVTEVVETILPYLLLIVGLFFIVRSFLHHHHDDTCHNSGHVIRRDAHWGAFVLGMLLAFLFCPESALFFFGMMVPVGVASTYGWAVPLVFAVAAVLPVMVLVWLMHTTIVALRRYERLMVVLQRCANLVTGLLFIALALALLI